MAIALVQQAVATDAAGSPIVAFSVTPGNSVLMVITYLSADSIDTNPNCGVPLTQAISKSVSGVVVEIWYLHNSAGSAFAFFAGANATRCSFQVSEWTGLANAAPDATNSASALVNASPATGSVTPASAAALVLGAGGWTADNYSSGPTNSFTRLTRTGGGAAWQEAGYQIESAVAAYSTGWALTAGINWAAVIAAFGASAAFGGGAKNLPLLGVG